MTDDDLSRLGAGGGEDWRRLVQWVGKDGIDLDDGRWFVLLRQGARLLVLRHRQGRCVYLGTDNRCTVYESRPLGCRVFPLDPEFTPRGALRRLRLIEATECPHALDGKQDTKSLYLQHQRYESANAAYLRRVATWNRQQRDRRRRGLQAQTARKFLEFLGF